MVWVVDLKIHFVPIPVSGNVDDMHPVIAGFLLKVVMVGAVAVKVHIGALVTNRFTAGTVKEATVSPIAFVEDSSGIRKCVDMISPEVLEIGAVG